MNLWPEARAGELDSLFAALAGETEMRFAFRSLAKTDLLQYFPDDLDVELACVGQGTFRHVPMSAGGDSSPHVAILTGHGNNVSRDLWELRESLRPGTVIAVWLWDNHMAYLNNLQSALVGDIVFLSHWFDAPHYYNPVALVGGHVPSCCAQWTTATAGRMMKRFGFGKRRDRVLANYVDYKFSHRSDILNVTCRQVDEIELLLMPIDDRDRYFSMSPDRRFQEWTDYKATLVLPVTTDLSTRVFDALLTGMVPIVPRAVSDFDLVISGADQEALGIVRLDSYDADAIRDACRRALGVFDEMGASGVRLRHEFVLASHMLAGRVRSMLNGIVRLASGELGINFADGPFGPALYSTPRSEV
jgi:hypothetical protein